MWFYRNNREDQFRADPDDMELLEEVDKTDLEAESYAVFND